MPNTNSALSLKDIITGFLFSRGGTAPSETKSPLKISKTVNAKSPTKNSKKGAASISVIGAGAVIDGNIYFENDVRFEGTIRGNITCKSALVMGPGSSVSGNVEANDVTMEGDFDGELRVKEIIRVKHTAIIYGEMHAPSMSTEYGATINGACYIGGTAN